MGLPQTEVSAEDFEAWLDRTAERVVALKLESLVEFAVESHVPTSTLLLNMGIVLQPFLLSVASPNSLARFHQLLADRANLERFLTLVRQKTESRTIPPGNGE